MYNVDIKVFYDQFKYFREPVYVWTLYYDVLYIIPNEETMCSQLRLFSKEKSLKRNIFRRITIANFQRAFSYAIPFSNAIPFSYERPWSKITGRGMLVKSPMDIHRSERIEIAQFSIDDSRRVSRRN